MRNREKLCRISIGIFPSALNWTEHYSAAKRSFLKENWSAPLWHSEISSHFKSSLPLLTRVLRPLSSHISHLSTSSSTPTPRLTHRDLTLVLSTFVFAARIVLFFFLFHYYVSLKFSLESRSRKSCESTSSWAHSYIFFWRAVETFIHFTQFHIIFLFSFGFVSIWEHLQIFHEKRGGKKRELVHEKRRKVGKSSFTVYFAWAYKHHHHRTPENDFSSVKRRKGFPRAESFMQTRDPRPKKIKIYRLYRKS